MKSLNVILYGPPGTGKTYQTSALAVQRIENLSQTQFHKLYPVDDRPLLRRRVDHHRDEGRYAFVVFHPSFSYEDFVEGIKPQSNERQELQYTIEDGIFKQMCIRAAHALYLSQQKNTLAADAPSRRSFDALFFEFVDYLKRSLEDDTQETVFESKTGKPFYLLDINQNNTLSLRMGKGNKAYPVSKTNLAKLYRKFDAADDIRSLRRDMPSSMQRVSSVAWAVFNRLKHYETTRNQTYQYLLEGKGGYNPVHYQAMKRDVQQLDYASLSPEDYARAGRFVLVIDEINRGNVAAIFGELIALIEEDKRGGQPEALRTTLPYSRESFSVPPNLFIVSTMNTADRSIEALDTALRRRFLFEAMNPDPTLLRSVEIVVQSDRRSTTDSELNVAAEPEGSYKSFQAKHQATYPIDLSRLLEVINRRLVALLDADHQVGHGYLMPVLSAQAPLEELRNAIYHKILPLLMEYFFSETDKVIAVIGRDFFATSDAVETSENFFAPNDLEEEWLVELSRMKKLQVRHLGDSEFISAVIKIYE